MAVRYRVAIKDEGNWSKPARLPAAMKELKRLLPEAGPWTFQIRGSEKSETYEDRARAMDRVKEALENRDVGDVIRLGTDEATVSVRIIEIQPKATWPFDPNLATPPVRALYEEVFGKFKGLENWGIYNCRNIAGTNTRSQHAFANAIDISKDGVPASLDEVNAFIAQNEDRFKISHRLWRVNGHFDHIHVDFSPQQSGDCRSHH